MRELNESNTILVSTKKDLLKLKSRQDIRYYCCKCGKLTYYRAFRPWRIEYLSKFMCGKCRSIEYNRIHFGVDYYIQSKDFKAKTEITLNKRTVEEKAEIAQKIKNTWKNKTQEEINARTNKIKESCLKTFGVDNPMKNPEIAKKVSDIWKNKSDIEKADIIFKISNSLFDRYGVRSVGELLTIEEFAKKSKKKKKDKYGDEKYNNPAKVSVTKKNWTPEQKQQMLDRLHKSNLKLYGVENSTQCPEIAQKIKNTWKNKTQEEINARTNKIKESLLRSTGFPRPIVGKTYYYGQRFDSAWELAVWIYCIDHNIPIIREPCSYKYFGANGVSDDHDYTPDFMIDGKLIEIKGDHWFKPDGTMYFPYNKKKVDGKWVKITPEEKAYKDDLFERKHQCGLANGVEFWKYEECLPCIKYCADKYNVSEKQWYKLFLINNPYNPSYWCGSIINPGYPQPQSFFLINNIGITPFDIKKERYVMSNDKGLTPFDI